MKKLNFTFFAILFTTASCFSQNLSKANYAYDNMSYYEAATYFEQSIKGKKGEKLYAKIAWCNLKMNKPALAAEWYKKSIEANSYQTPDLLNYAIALKNSGNMEEAKLWFDKYLAGNPGDKTAIALKESCDLYPIYYKDSSEWNIHMLDLGGTESKFSPAFYDNGLVFCSAGLNGPKSSWDGKPYLDLYHVQFQNNGQFSEKHLLGNSINSIFHEGPAVFSKGYHEVFFTRSNFLNGKFQKNSKDESVLRLYTAIYAGDDWENIIPLPFSSAEINMAHPALNTKEDYLYFASDMPGGFGGFDLYRVQRSSAEIWETPENLGSSVNTAGDELFPTINFDESEAKEYLYYSSNSKPGMGGLDVYRIEIFPTANELSGTENFNSFAISDNFGAEEHLLYPINSTGDDFGLILIHDKDSGYLSSSRDNQTGTDNIYKFNRKTYKYFMKGVVKNKTDLSTISKAHVLIIQSNGTKKYELQTNDNGEFIIEIDTNSVYQLEGKKEHFYKNHATANSKGIAKSDTLEVEIILDPIVLNQAIRLDNIYYDYNKWNIRVDAALELDKMLKVLLENPEINIELSSHTDVRGNDQFNMTLSQKRAQAAVDYIISKGIDPARIYAKGYGESVVLNRCKNKVKCSEEEHQLNRRTEFKVVKIN